MCLDILKDLFCLHDKGESDSQYIEQDCMISDVGARRQCPLSAVIP